MPRHSISSILLVRSQAWVRARAKRLQPDRLASCSIFTGVRPEHDDVVTVIAAAPLSMKGYRDGMEQEQIWLGCQVHRQMMEGCPLLN